MNRSTLAGTLLRGWSYSYRGSHLGASLDPSARGAERLGTIVADDRRLGAHLDAVGRDVGSPRRDVQASLLLESYAWTLLLPLAGALVREQRVPMLGRHGVAVAFGDSGIWPERLVLLDPRFFALESDADSNDVDALRARDGVELARRLRDELIGHLAVLLRPLATCSGRPERALWRSVADRAAAAFLFAGEALDARERAEQTAIHLLGGPPPLVGGPRYRELDSGRVPAVVHMRHGCCLWWRTSVGTSCATCPLEVHGGLRGYPKKTSAVS